MMNLVGGVVSNLSTRRFLSVLLVLTSVLPVVPCLEAEAQYTLLGKHVPYFQVRSGEDEMFDREMAAGKVVVMFYETKDVATKNSTAKDHLNNLYKNQPVHIQNRIARLPVFNFSRYFWPFTLILKNSLVEHSRRVGMTLYGDWNGKILDDLRLKDDESNVVMIDRKGVVRYHFAGRIGKEELKTIETVLDRLVHEE